MNSLILCLLACTLSGGLAAAVILLTKGLLKDKLSPVWHCYAWILVFLLLLLPVTVKWELPQMAVLPIEELRQLTAQSAVSYLENSPKPTIDPAKPTAPNASEVHSETAKPILSQTAQTTVEMSPAASQKPDSTAVSEMTNNTSSALEDVSSIQGNVGSVAAQLNFSKAELLCWGGSAMLIIWLLGIVFSLKKQSANYRYFLSTLRWSEEEPDEETLHLLRKTEWDMGFRLRPPVRLAVSPLINTPLIVGLFHPVMYVPKQKLDHQKLSLIFVHELTHYKYGDLFYKAFAQLLCAIHWFNPLCTMMVEDIDFSCELCCDRRVRRHIGTNRSKEYGTLLLEMMSMDLAQNPSAGFSMDKKDLKRRLSLIVKPKRTSRALSTVLAMGIAFTGTTCSSYIAPELDLWENWGSWKVQHSENKKIQPSRQPNVETYWGIYPRSAYEAGLPGMKEWLASCDNKDDEQVYAVYQTKDIGNSTMYRWFIYDPKLTKDSTWDIEGSLYRDGITITADTAYSGESALLLITEYYRKSDDVVRKQPNTNLGYVRDGESMQLKASSAKFDLFATLSVSVQEGIPDAPRGGFRFPLVNSSNNYYEILNEFEDCQGLDIAANLGAMVKPAAEGVVTFAGWVTGEGYSITVNHGDGWATRYSHLHYINVEVGQKLKSSSTLGYVGSTGDTEGNMLHFEIYYEGNPQNPADYLSYPPVHVPEEASDAAISLHTAQCDVCGYADVLEAEAPCKVCGEGEMLFYEITYSDWRYIGVTSCSAHGQYSRAQDIVVERDLIKTYKGQETRTSEQNYLHVDETLNEDARIFLLFQRIEERFKLLFDQQAERIYEGYNLTSAEGDNYERKHLFRKNSGVSEGAFYLTDGGSLSPDNAVIKAAFEFYYTDTVSQRIYNRFLLRCGGDDAQLSNLFLIYEEKDGQEIRIPLSKTESNHWIAEFEDIASLKIPSSGFRLQGIMTRSDKAYPVEVEL